MTDRFATILCDAPWRYRNFSEAKHGAASHHYETMPVEDIAAIPVERWAEDDAVLAMWGTWPLLVECIRVMGEWGFQVVTGMPWVKTVPSTGQIRCGIGFFVQSASEYLLLGRRGNLKRLREAPHLRGLLVGDERTFYAPTGKHSAKPPEVHEWLEATFPGPRLELFARRQRPGWTCLGLELGHRLSAAGVEQIATAPAGPLFTGAP